MLTKDGKGGRRGEPEDDKGEGGLDSGNPQNWLLITYGRASSELPFRCLD